MKLITERNFENVQVLEEEANGKKVEASVHAGSMDYKL